MNASGTRRGHAYRSLEASMFGVHAMGGCVCRPSRKLRVPTRYVIAMALILNGVSLPLSAAASGRGNGPVADGQAARAPLHGLALQPADPGATRCAQSAAGTFVVDRLDAQRLHGYFFAAAAESNAAYLARVDAALNEASAVAPSITYAPCGDVDDTGSVLTQLMQAAATKDQDALRRLTVPENLHMWNNFGVINAMQRTARRQQRMISCSRGEAGARIWIVPTLADSGSHLPASIELAEREGKWLFAAIHY